MKISSKLFSDQQLNLLSKQMEDIQSIQSKISSGKNIVFASDDIGAVKLSGLNDVSNKVQQYIKNSNYRLVELNDGFKPRSYKNVFINVN